MRCPTCGTENAPDSRFCGGCGARVSGVDRVAPTQKIADDAKWTDRPSKPQPSAPASAYLSQPPQMPRTASTPPTMPPPEPRSVIERAATDPPRGSQKSIPPVTAQQPVTRTTPQPIVPVSTSISPPVRRGRGLIAFVLVVDLGLAAAGAVLLVQGLGGGERAAVPKTDAGPGSANPAEKKPGSGATGAVTPPASSAARSSTGSTRAAGPVDPYADANAEVSAAIGRMETRAQPAVDRCYAAATADKVGKGTVTIGFQVEPDGKVVHVAVTDNSSGSEALAGCIVSEIAGWVLPSHAGDAVSFVRSFTFNPGVH